MAVKGPYFPTTTADGGAGGNDWVDMSNVTANDGSEASVVSPNSGSSDWLHATGFGFAIPTGSTINGIEVVVEGRHSASDTHMVVQIVKGGTRTGIEKYQPITTTNTAYTLGGAADLWSGTFSASDINNANFGVAIQSGANAGFITLMYCDYLTIKVTYTEPPGQPIAKRIGGNPFSYQQSTHIFPAIQRW